MVDWPGGELSKSENWISSGAWLCKAAIFSFFMCFVV